MLQDDGSICGAGTDHECACREMENMSREISSDGRWGRDGECKARSDLDAFNSVFVFITSPFTPNKETTGRQASSSAVSSLSAAGDQDCHLLSSSYFECFAVDVVKMNLALPE
ncbi:uncharacterized protein V3H82_027681 [Fundulus diaphanus]